jgi:hypothetical protein
MRRWALIVAACFGLASCGGALSTSSSPDANADAAADSAGPSSDASRGAPNASSSSGSSSSGTSGPPSRPPCDGQDMAGVCFVCAAGVLSEVGPECKDGWLQCSSNGTELDCQDPNAHCFCDAVTGEPSNEDRPCGPTGSCPADTLCILLPSPEGGVDAGPGSTCAEYPKECLPGVMTPGDQCGCLKEHLSPDGGLFGLPACASYSCDYENFRPAVTCLR